MSKRILSDKDRKTLLAKYKEDKLNDAPANISDKVLIENYGTDEQKALLATPAPKAGTATTNQTPTADNGNGNTPAATPTPSPATNDEGNDSGKVGADKEREHQVAEYKRLYGVEPNADWETGEITAYNVTKTNEIASAERNNPQRQEYIDALNQYITLHGGQAPTTQLTYDDLIAANEQKTLELSQPSANAPTPAATPTVQDNAGSFEGKPMPNLTATTTNKDVEKIACIHKDGRKKEFSKFTYDNYVSKDQDWKRVPQEPIEVQGL